MRRQVVRPPRCALEADRYAGRIHGIPEHPLRFGASAWRLHAVNPTGAYSAFPGVVHQLQQTLATLEATRLAYGCQ